MKTYQRHTQKPNGIVVIEPLSDGEVFGLEMDDLTDKAKASINAAVFSAKSKLGLLEADIDGLNELSRLQRLSMAQQQQRNAFGLQGLGMAAAPRSPFGGLFGDLI